MSASLPTNNTRRNSLDGDPQRNLVEGEVAQVPVRRRSSCCGVLRDLLNVIASVHYKITASTNSGSCMSYFCMLPLSIISFLVSTVMLITMPIWGPIYLAAGCIKKLLVGRGARLLDGIPEAIRLECKFSIPEDKLAQLDDRLFYVDQEFYSSRGLDDHRVDSIDDLSCFQNASSLDGIQALLEGNFKPSSDDNNNVDSFFHQLDFMLGSLSLKPSSTGPDILKKLCPPERLNDLAPHAVTGLYKWLKQNLGEVPPLWCRILNLFSRDIMNLENTTEGIFTEQTRFLQTLFVYLNCALRDPNISFDDKMLAVRGIEETGLVCRPTWCNVTYQLLNNMYFGKNTSGQDLLLAQIQRFKEDHLVSCINSLEGAFNFQDEWHLMSMMKNTYGDQLGLDMVIADVDAHATKPNEKQKQHMEEIYTNFSASFAMKSTFEGLVDFIHEKYLQYENYKVERVSNPQTPIPSDVEGLDLIGFLNACLKKASKDLLQEDDTNPVDLCCKLGLIDDDSYLLTKLGVAYILVFLDMYRYQRKTVTYDLISL